MSRQITLIFCLVFYISYANGQLMSTVQDVKSNFEFFHKSNPSEKVYVKTDKDIYHPGDNLWYSGFLVDYNSLKPSEISQSLFVDIIDSKNRLIGNSRTRNYNGVTKGDFVLSDTLKPGIYELVAYSSLQKQTISPKSFFRKYIRVVDTKPSTVTFSIENDNGELLIKSTDSETGGSISNLKMDYELYHSSGLIDEGSLEANSDGTSLLGISDSAQFVVLRSKYLGANNFYYSAIEDPEKVEVKVYAESGNFVEGLLNKVVFSVQNNLGKPLELEGKLFKDSVVIKNKVKSDKNGIGSFYLLPKGNEKYKLQFQYLGNEIVYEFDPPNENGYTYSQKQIDNKLVFNIHSQSKETDKVYLMGHIRGEIVFAAMLDFKESYTYGQDIGNLPDGILQTFIMNKEREILASSAVYINHDKKSLDYQVESLAETNNRLLINGDGLGAWVSVGVRDIDVVASDFGYSMNDYLTFFSDLDLTSKSYTVDNLDEFLLTQMPQRYEWFKKKEVPPLPPSGILGYDKIIGVAMYENDEPLVNENLILHSQGKDLRSWFASTDDNGRFEFEEVDIEPGAFVVLNALKIKQRRKVKFELEESSVDIKYSFDPKIWDTYLSSEASRYYDSLVDLSGAIVLENVTKKSRRYNEEIEDRKFRLDNIRTTKADELQLNSGGSGGNILSILQQATTIYSWNNLTGSVLLRAPKTFVGGSGVIFYVNNMRIGSNMFDLSYLNPNDIAEIKVYRTMADAMDFPFAPDGVIQIITKKGYIPSYGVKNNHMKILEPSYTETRDFNLIKNDPQMSNSEDPTLLWFFNYLNLNSDKAVNLDYQNINQVPHKISIEGISSDGEVISIDKIID